MQTLATLAALIVAAEHFYIMYLEICRIPGPQAARIFGLPEEFMRQKRVQVMFANQGLYNGFLAAGIIWAQFFAPQNASSQATLLFLGFVITAAVWGAATSNKGILLKQGLPALLAFLAVAVYA
ncbi:MULTISPECIES: DUF1304 domain-containing protein [Neisseria]|uniref:DUF1304 domain-containing protein n=1 Tax=Neisseria musculi TaxID=1815583 RepID=A0A7H1MEK5_9NEIS|nr:MULTISPECIES: DUF1304 domain-containing protein [Neisseria]MBF0804173.1 DUF1304 domain-containing protein [Neisseria sp. 19428wB4_WF04]QNT60070.1 hypothetical protein H7A79_1347 [Neisseria musculi]TFU43073.1 DUF1304 domain-containing protein [Neisseria sp. WF04]